MYNISKIYRHRIIWATVIPAVTSVFFSFVTAVPGVELPIISRYISFLFYANDPLTEFAMMLSLIIYFVFLCCLTGVFTDDLQIHTTYCFTRKKNIMKWYFSVTALLFVLSAVAVLSYVLCGSTVILISGKYSFHDIITDFGAISKTTLLAWLFVFSTSFFANAMSLFVKKKYILPVVIFALLIFAAFIPISIKKENIMLFAMNPVVRLNSSLHTDILSRKYFELHPESVDVNIFGLKFLTSVLYFIGLSAVSFAIGFIAVKKTDVAMKTEE